jgi:alpha-L-fucosidase
MGFGLALFLCAFSASAQNFSDVKPSPQQIEWQDLEFGVIIHFSTNTFLDREWGDGTADPSVFNPTQFDPDQWMKAIRDSGAKYVVLVAKHHDGFCLWPTEQTSYSVKSSPWQNGHGDVVGEVARAARKYGLKFGVYLSPWDRHEPKYKDSAAYDAYYQAELSELASNYGDLVEFWLDGAGSAGHVYNFEKIIETLRTYQPNTIVFADTGLFEYGDARWVGNESGHVPYENWNVIDRHGYLRWRPVEADTPLRNRHWFWHPNDEGSLKSLNELLTIYDETVGRGAQLMLGVAPDRRGLLPDSDVARLEESVRAQHTILPSRMRQPRLRLLLRWTATQIPSGAHLLALITLRLKSAFPDPSPSTAQSRWSGSTPANVFRNTLSTSGLEWAGRPSLPLMPSATRRSISFRPLPPAASG